MTKEPMTDVVVLLPGITGSVLKRDGKDVWAFSPGAILGGLLSRGHSVTKLELADDDWKQDDLGDGVTADRVMPDLHLIPGLWKIDGYGEVMKFLTDTFELTEGENFFPFAYDWRRDNRASARLLQQRSHNWLTAWREKSGNDDAKLVLIGHSMGGLVSRYFVEALEGWKDTRAVITLGAPFYGSVNAIDFLENGMRKGIGPFGVDLSPMLRSFTSVHQLVPVYRCVFDAAGTQVAPVKAGLPKWKPEWGSHLTDFHQEMETAANSNRQDRAWEKGGTIYRPVVGTDQRTRQSAKIVGDKVELLYELAGKDGGGDGTVPGVSAALDGTQNAAMFSPQQHARIQNYGSVLDHLKGALKSLHAVKISDLRELITSWFSFVGGDIYAPDEPISFELAVMSRMDEEQLPGVRGTVSVKNRETKKEVQRKQIDVGRTHSSFELPPLGEGTFTIEVTAAGAAPVSDVFAVLGPLPPE
jgi:lecithin:cholesterol acyltransferase